MIDADLRKGNCHTLVGWKNHHGLTNILTDGMTLEKCVRRTAVAGLFLRSRGAVSPYLTDLPGSSKMKELLQDLRERFEFVLIDSPPAIAVSDAVVLSVQCEGVLLVIRAQRIIIESARRLVE